MIKPDDRGVVMSQYATSEKLTERISLHEKYGTNPLGWFNWLFENLALTPGAKVLELGCGNGKLWSERLERVPDGVSVVLSDFFEGMTTQAKAEIGGDNRFEYMVIDAQDIPFPDASFDIVAANMLLHHVPEIDRAVSEIRRVLRPGGRFCCATIGESGIGGFVKETLGLDRSGAIKFTLQNGKSMLTPHFDSVEKLLYDDSLAVTDAQDLIDYIRTLPWVEELASISDDIIREKLEKVRKDGIISVPKEYGMFVAK